MTDVCKNRFSSNLPFNATIDRFLSNTSKRFCTLWTVNYSISSFTYIINHSTIGKDMMKILIIANVHAHNISDMNLL
jgi:hypothetical protein